MDHSLILQWAAGDKNYLHPTFKYEEKKLLDLIRLHNLSGRFLKKLEKFPHYNFSDKFQKSLKEHHKNVIEHVDRNLKAFLEIKNNLPRDIKIISIKGFSTYVIVNKREIIRTGDIDIISNYGVRLTKVLKKLNYKMTRNSFLHELGEYTKDSIEIDVHKYFPIYSYTNPLIFAVLDPEKNPDLWQQSYVMRKIDITYDLLSQYLYEGCIENTMGVVTGDPNIMIIIICAHAFMNFVNIWSISHREKAYVRLGELADLFELVEHTGFNQSKFWELVDKLQAYDAIKWAHYIAGILFKKSLFQDKDIYRHKLIDHTSFPRNLWWNFWIILPIKEELILTNDWYSIELLINQLGSNILAIDNNLQKKYTTVPTKLGTILSRLIIQNNLPISVTLAINWDKKYISIYLDIAGALENFERIRIDFGHQASEWSYSVKEGQESIIGAPVETNFVLGEGGYKIQLKYEFELIKNPNVIKPESLPLFIGIGKLSSPYKMVNSILIPLTLIFSELDNRKIN